MDVSVIVVNYNTCQMTLECINSIFQKTIDINFEVIVVDNASTDGSKEMFSKDPRIIYIYQNENLGFGKANNLGLGYAKGTFVFLLNSDTLLLNNAIKIFFDFASCSVSEIGALGCLLFDGSYNVTHSYGSFPNFKNSIDEWILYPFIYQINSSYIPYKYDPKGIQKSGQFEVDYITGAALFLRREICLAHGMFDPEYFMYYEETDLQFRYSKLGLKRIVLDTPKIVHYMGGSNGFRGRRSILKKILPLRSLFLFLGKHNGKVRSKLFLKVFLLLYIPVVLLSRNAFKEKIQFIRMLMKLKCS